MEREANYAAVGAFVLLVALLGALFVYWYSDAREHRNYNRYEIYFSGSVSGLERGAAVRYLGVGVGRVVDMHIDPRDSSRVEVIVDIDATTPISAHTVAQLQLQGVTGLLYIDLFEAPSNKLLAPAVAGLRFPVIRSGPSRFDVFLASLPELVAAAGDVVQRADLLLSDANLHAVSNTLGSLERASSTLPQTVHDLNALVTELRGATTELAASARSTHALIDAVGPDVQAAAQRMHSIADHLASASEQLDRVIADNREAVLEMLQRFSEDLTALQRAIRWGEGDKLEELFSRTRAIRRSIIEAKQA